MIRVCSVATARSLASVRLLVEDLRAHHDEVGVALLDVDGVLDPTDDVVAVPAARLMPSARELHLEALASGRSGLVRLLAVRLLAEVLEGAHLPGSGPVVWLSPGSAVLGPLDDVPAAAAGGLSVVARVPAPAEPRPVGEVHAAGVWSDAIVGLDTAVAPLLREVGELGATAPGHPPLLDLLVARSPHRVLTDAGLAVSSWSLADAALTAGPDGPLLRGAPVRHLDLTGFDPATPWLLDARARAPRALVSRDPLLARLLEERAARLHRATGPERLPAFGHLADGTPVDDTVRGLVRRAREDGHLADVPDLLASPPDVVRAWLLEPGEGELPVARYLQGLYLDRPDVRAAIPGVPHHNVRAFLAWVRDHARTEPGYDLGLLEAGLEVAASAEATASAPTTAEPPPPGLNVVGYLRGELGVGESARLVVTAARAADVPHRTYPVTRHLQSRQAATYTSTAETGPPFDTTLLCVNADMLGEIVPLVPELVTGRHRIGMWYWEVEHFPAAQAAACDLVDEIWTATDFVRDAVQAVTDKPVVTVTPPLPTPRPTTDLTRADLGLPPDVPLLLFSFDFLSTVERKNPYGLLEAFRRAFAPGEGPVLVLKTINADRRVAEAERLRLRVAQEPDVLLLEGYLDADARDALVLLCDAYVSLHRAEGLGLTMAEAMALGKPVVATGYSGNLQFMTPENSFLVPYRLVPIPAGCDPYPAGTPWADPDLDAAAQALRSLVDDPEAAAARGRRAAQDIATLHSAATAGARIADRLEEIRRARPHERGSAARRLLSAVRRR